MTIVDQPAMPVSHAWLDPDARSVARTVRKLAGLVVAVALTLGFLTSGTLAAGLVLADHLAQ
jgi:hypothetical protein